MLSAPTYSAAALTAARVQFNPPLSPRNALYCPVPIKPENAHKYNFKKEKHYDNLNKVKERNIVPLIPPPLL